MDGQVQKEGLPFPVRKARKQLRGARIGTKSGFREGVWGFLSEGSVSTQIGAWVESLGGRKPLRPPSAFMSLRGGGFWLEGAGWAREADLGEGGPGQGAGASGDCLPRQGWRSDDAVCPADSSALVPRLERKGAGLWKRHGTF